MTLINCSLSHWVANTNFKIFWNTSCISLSPNVGIVWTLHHYRGARSCSTLIPRNQDFLQQGSSIIDVKHNTKQNGMIRLTRRRRLSSVNIWARRQKNTSCQIFRYEKYWRSPEAHKGFDGDGDVVGDISIQGAVAITWCRTPAHGWKTNAFEHQHRQAREYRAAYLMNRWNKTSKRPFWFPRTQRHV